MQAQGEYKHTELDRSGSLFQLLMNSILMARALTITHWQTPAPNRRHVAFESVFQREVKAGLVYQQNNDICSHRILLFMWPVRQHGLEALIERSSDERQASEQRASDARTAGSLMVAVHTDMYVGRTDMQVDHTDI